VIDAIIDELHQVNVEGCFVETLWNVTVKCKIYKNKNKK